MKLIHLNWVFALLAGTILLSSCGASRQANQLLDHQQILAKMASDTTIAPGEKFDMMMTSMTGMMHEGMRIVNPKKGVNYVTKFGSQNAKSIDGILNEFAAWQKGMAPAERVAFNLSMLQKPYAKDALELIPKFVSKYKQITFVTRTMKRVKTGIVGFGRGQLGNLGNGGILNDILKRQ